MNTVCDRGWGLSGAGVNPIIRIATLSAAPGLSAHHTDSNSYGRVPLSATLPDPVGRAVDITTARR